MQRGFMRKLIIVLLAALFPVLEGAARAQSAIHVIDVGQADAILLEFKSSAILIDAGGESTGDDRDKEHFISDLNAFFANRRELNRTLQAIIVTHPHIDHTRLLMDVFQNFTVKYFYDGGDIKGSGAPQLKQAREYASSHAIKYAAIRDEAIGKEGFTPAGLKNISSGADVRFLAGSRDCANENNNSLVVRVRFGDKTALLTGDSETDDDDECEEGQVEHLLERYQGTDLLRADVYKVGHHGSHNGTDQAFVLAVSPAIAIISAGHTETREPTKFHGFFYGHPREDVVELLEATTGNRNPPVSGYTYLKGTKNKDATDTIIEGRLIAKAIYCTCWDGDVTVAMDGGGGEFAVSASSRRPIDQGDQPKLMNVVEPIQQPAGKPLQFVIPASSDGSNLSPRQRSILMVVLLLIPVPIYVLMKLHEIRRERLLEEMAVDLIQMSDGEAGWKFTRFELAAMIWRSRAERPILRNLWPKPRIGLNEVIEQAVAQVIRVRKYGSPVEGMGDRQRKTLIKKLENLHSDPKNPTDLLGPLPSTMFLVASVPVIVLFIAIQAVPSVGSYLAGVFGHNSLLEELWTGLLATIVGTGATLLPKKSIYHRESVKPPMKSQDPPEATNQKVEV
jgi:competence protein ComEC